MYRIEVFALDLIIPTISQGLLWSLMAIGVYITFRVLDIADLTVEGSLPFGWLESDSGYAGGGVCRYA